MFIVSGIVTMEPEGHDAAVELFGPLTEATLAEDGNITYGFWADPARPGVFRVYEEWATLDAMGAHMASAHMAEFLTAMASLPITGTEITQHEVTASQRLM
ncbi:MAG: antibiotic biosynthesis monooxygenase [Actinobacteria bacterium]|nr:antibiotic biosynthesis monooxygenase [Actinomycetota bacterium]